MGNNEAETITLAPDASGTPLTYELMAKACYPATYINEIMDSHRSLERSNTALRADLARVTGERDHAVTGYDLTTKALMEAFEFKALPMQCARFAIDKYNALKAAQSASREVLKTQINEIHQVGFFCAGHDSISLAHADRIAEKCLEIAQALEAIQPPL